MLALHAPRPRPFDRSAGATAQLVGGIYGVKLGRAFFGESMFSRRTDASKVALAWLVARLKAGGYTLLDCQFITDHLASLGAVAVPRATYVALLSAALGGGAAGSGAGAAAGGAAGAAPAARIPRARRGCSTPRATAAPRAAAPPGKVIAQLFGQTS